MLVVFPAPAYGVLLPISDANKTVELVSHLIKNDYFDTQTTVAMIDMTGKLSLAASTGTSPYCYPFLGCSHECHA